MLAVFADTEGLAGVQAHTAIDAISDNAENRGENTAETSHRKYRWSSTARDSYTSALAPDLGVAQSRIDDHFSSLKKMLKTGWGDGFYSALEKSAGQKDLAVGSSEGRGMRIGFEIRSLILLSAWGFLASCAATDSEAGDNEPFDSEQAEGTGDTSSDSSEIDDEESFEGIPGPGEEGFVNTAKIETCFNRETGFCQVTLVSSAAMDSSEFTCRFESGQSVASCPVEGCLGKCTTDFDAQRLIRYAYEQTEEDFEAACLFIEGQWTTDCGD